jgi:UPI0000360E50 related cluster
MNIGYWWSDKKDLRINGNELKRLVGEKNFNLVKLDLHLSLEEQGPFLIFIHKLSDLIIKADQNDHKSSQIIHAFEVSKH